MEVVQNDATFRMYCGWGRVDAKTMNERIVEASRYADEAAAAYAKEFMIIGAKESSAGKCARLHKAVKDITAADPRVDAQLTGDCVSMGSRQCLIMRSCVEIVNGDLEQYKWVFAPYHYATGRVLIGKNRLRGSAGSMGGWQAEANTEYGYLADEDTGGLKYGKAIADAWGDDKPFQGKAFRDFIENAKLTTLRQWARVQSWNDSRDAIFNGYPLSICSSRGYTMMPGADGFHMPSGVWPHCMTVYAFWENVKIPCVAILNSWGDVHGIVHDPETGEQLPKGTILVRLEHFIKQHLVTSQTECIAFSDINGFKANIDWSRYA